MGQKVVIIGGVAGGASAAARLRRLDEEAEIIMFERDGFISFANCGLPYFIGGEIKKREHLLLQTPESFYHRFHVDVRVYSEVTAIDPAQKRVTVKNRETGETYEESYDKLILSPGAMPVKPPIAGLDSGRVFTLRNVHDTDHIKAFITEQKPKRAVVAGGGYIGVEMAENLVTAGLEVTILQRPNQLIAPLDYDMACDVHRHVESRGVTLLLETVVSAVEERGDALHVTHNKGALDTDMLILAIGVQPETKLAKDAGLQLNERGAIVVNEHMLSSDESIYAVGDAVEIWDFVTGQKAVVPLAGPANKQGRIAADNICGIKSRYKGAQRSAILRVFDMTVATTGINEKMAKAMGLDYEKSFTYSANHASYYPGAKSLSLKLIYERTSGKILGAQVVGYEGSDKRCDVIATAMRFGATAEALTELELCYAPPFSSAKDPVNMAGYVVENLLAGHLKQFHWHEVDGLPRDGSVTLLDVRTPTEYAAGHAEGFINLPVDALRDQMDTLDKSKPIYLTCQVGLRGYIACRMLTQHGFDCYNLSGGYRLYHSVTGGRPFPVNCTGDQKKA